MMADSKKIVYLGCVERVIKALFLINGGGTIALFSYAHTHPDLYSNSNYLSHSLLSFVIGLLFAHVTVGFDYLFVLINKVKNSLLIWVGAVSWLSASLGIVFAIIGFWN